jgi:hypothetical protein
MNDDDKINTDVIRSVGDLEARKPRGGTRCLATSRAGDRCKNPVSPFATVCAFHGGKSPQARAHVEMFMLAARDWSCKLLYELITRDPAPDDFILLKAIGMVLDRTGIPANITISQSSESERFAQMSTEELLEVAKQTAAELQAAITNEPIDVEVREVAPGEIE